MASANQIFLSDIDILTGLHMLPDAAALTTDEAAIFLRLSKSTMERMRHNGGGPDYLQGGPVGARGLNQKITYIKSDLTKYQQSSSHAMFQRQHARHLDEP
jgi:hypothetical protein